MRRSAVVLVAILLSGCGTIVVDDITVMEDDYLRSRKLVLEMAAGELSCPSEQLETKVLGVTVHADIERMQVRGCEQEAVYVRGPNDAFARETSPPKPE